MKEQIEDALWQDYKDACGRIEKMNGTEQNYHDELEERDRIRNEIIKMKQLSQDKELKENETKVENRNEIIRTVINVATTATTLVIQIVLCNKTFKFDQQSTVTSTLGRGILNGVTPKLKK